jgi:hypothetical protein
MDDLFQRPLGSVSIILNFSKKFCVKADIKKLSMKVHFETVPIKETDFENESTF